MSVEPLETSETFADSTSVIVVAAGSSNRMGGTDKLELMLGPRPVLWHSLNVFARCDAVSRMALVTRSEKLDETRALVNKWQFGKPINVVAGGTRRQDSVKCGIDALISLGDVSEYIAVHDAARPLVDGTILMRGLIATSHVGAAIPATPVKDTIKRVEHGIVVETPDRNSTYAVQTPQVFRRDVLIAAHETVPFDVSDDAAMVETAGGLVGIFEGAETNIKITTPNDFMTAKAIVGARSSDLSGSRQNFRYGTGFDGHRLVDGGPLTLGGIQIEFAMHLEGHSDGDVLLHAVASAILGAAGMGDLGSNFPSSDPRYENVASRYFLTKARDRGLAQGWQIDHIDATIIAQRPRLSGYTAQMVEYIADALALATSGVNVKLTSTDHVGAIGSGEGIASQAIVTLKR